MEGATVANVEKTRRYYRRLWNERDFSVIPDWISPDFVGHYTSRPEPVRGVEGFRSVVDELLTGFPDLRMEIEDTISEGDKVVSRVAAVGTHRGVFNGWAPTGLTVTSTFVGIERYVDGLCVEEWVYSDDVGAARQMRALPEAGSRGERLAIALHRLSTARLRRRS